MIIETLNLIIETIDEESLKYILDNMYDATNTPIPRNASNYQIKKFLAFNKNIICFNSLGYFSIRLKKTSKIIGFLSIIPRYIEESLINELGYFIMKEYRNKGFMYEALVNTLNLIFKKTNITKIYSLVDKCNSVSKHLLYNKIKFDFLCKILDSNNFKEVYYIDRLKFFAYRDNVNYCSNKY